MFWLNWPICCCENVFFPPIYWILDDRTIYLTTQNASFVTIFLSCRRGHNSILYGYQLVHQLWTSRLQQSLPLFSCATLSPAMVTRPQQPVLASCSFSARGGGLCWFIQTLFSGFWAVSLPSSVPGLRPSGQKIKNKKLTGCHRNQVYKFRAFQLTGLSTVHILFKGKTEAIEGNKMWDTSMAFMHLSIAWAEFLSTTKALGVSKVDKGRLGSHFVALLFTQQ